ncbi:MAG: C39 family peptidase [Parcubacteria group bacterium]|nr:C39 family peptidase [Parcubacteria group bacterium]
MLIDDGLMITEEKPKVNNIIVDNFFMKKILAVIVILGIAGIWYMNQSPDLPEAVPYSDVIATPLKNGGSNPVNQETSSDSQLDPSAPLSSAETADSSVAQDDVRGEYNLAVPFQSQAPHADWSLPYQEACEEASLIMADRFFSGDSLSADQMDSAIKELVAWEQNTFGYYEDTTAAEVAFIWQEYFKGSAVLDDDVSVENIKRHISSNKLVVVPAAGRMLGNPYFTGDGPLYHMLIIRGYTPTQFITNDPGTKRGEEFVYTHAALINAIADWPRPHGGFKDAVTEEEMRSSQKVLIVLDK